MYTRVSLSSVACSYRALKISVTSIAGFAYLVHREALEERATGQRADRTQMALNSTQPALAFCVRLGDRGQQFRANAREGLLERTIGTQRPRQEKRSLDLHDGHL